jgi:type I restriction enzyme M protein
MKEIMKKRNDNDRRNYDENYDKAIKEKIILIEGDNITYQSLRSGPKTYSLKKPEEQVRAKVYASLIYKYGYPKEHIDFEVKVQNLSKGYADIVIYYDQYKVWAVIETKKENCEEKDYEEAVKRQYYYAFNLTAIYYIIDTLDTYNEYLVFDESGEKTNGAEIETKFPNYNETITNEFTYIKGENEIASLNQQDLNYIVKKIFDMIKGNGVRTNDDALHVLSQIIFVKSMDELYTNDTEHYKCQIGHKENGNLLDVAKRFKEIYSRLYQQSFLNDYPEIYLDDKSLYKIIKLIQSFSLINTDAEIRRKAFENLLSLVYKQEFGQFFTHRNIIKFCVYCMSIEENSNICDPACGTGGFLIMSYLRMLEEIDVVKIEEKVKRQNAVLNRLHGYEINQNISRIAKFNLFLTTLQSDSQGIENKDSLLKNNRQKKQEKPEIKYDFVFTNPPFGSSVSKTLEHKDYELFKSDKQFSDILFIEHCINILKEGDTEKRDKSGSMVIILPEGILNNDSLKYVRRYIQQQAFVKAVVSLPIHAFKKAGAGAKTSIVFLEKYTKQEKELYDEMFSQNKSSAETEKKQLEEKVGNDIVSFLNNTEFVIMLSEIATPYSEYIKYVKENYDVDKHNKECKIKVEGKSLQDAIDRFKELPKYQSIYNVGDKEDESKTLYDIYDNIQII